MRFEDTSGNVLKEEICLSHATKEAVNGGWQRVHVTFRGYYYDADLELYYLGSRYYDAVIGRFINADSVAVLGVQVDLYDKNLYAYCDNNPVVRIDTDGEFWNIAAGAVIGAAISVVSQIVGNVMSGEKASSGVVMAAITGAASGALSAGTLGKWGQAVANAGISWFAESINQSANGTFNTIEGKKAIAKATISGLIAGRLGGDGMRNKKSDYYKVAQGAKNVAQKVCSKTYSNTRTPTKLLNHAIKAVRKVKIVESVKTGIKFGAGSALTQFVTKYNFECLK